MKDLPVIEPKEIITTITNMKTGEVYKDDSEWKAKGIAESDIRKDVRVIMPSLDLFGETKQNRQMAITNAQQYKQLVNPPMKGKKRPGYKGGQDMGAGSSGMGSGNTGGNTGGDKGRNPMAQFSSGPPSAKGRQGVEDMRAGLRSAISSQNRAAAFNDFKKGLKNVFDKTLIGRAVGFLGNLGPNKGFSTQGSPYGNAPGGMRDYSSTEDDDDKGGGDGMPRYAQLGYPSQEAYMAAMQRATQASAGLPAAVQPMQTMNLNRIAYRLMADGGFLGEEDEPRQAYGLGSIVRKITRPIKKVVKKATSAVKKVVKSPIGKLALAVAAPYALGPAMAQSQFLMGLSAAQRAALVSGATTGITQLASGEDLDLKDIALSAALSGGVSKFTAPKGIDGKAFNASRASQASKFQMPRGGGADFSKIAASAKDVTPKTGILQSLKNIGTKVTDSKLGNLLIGDGEGGISPMKSILLASGLSGLAAKKDFEEDEFSEMDRGEKLDIAAIRRRPFDYMAPRFAGSEFDFYAADGGRIGYSDGTDLSKNPNYKGWVKVYKKNPDAASMNENHSKYLNFYERNKTKKAKGSKEPVAKKVMPLLDMGGQEMDLRAEGGFVPIGRMEKADDVPARLSKNEFVFTAEAVRNAGEGDVDKGAEVMYNMMKNLESGGDVSEESQGLEGARRMFQTSQRLEEVL